MNGPTRAAGGDTTIPTVGIPTAPPLFEDLQALLRRLRLPHIRRHAPQVVATAKAQRWEPVEVLRALFGEKAAGRERSALVTRRAAGAFPAGKTFDARSPGASSIPAPTQQALRTLEWVHRQENLVVCGPSGTGKIVGLRERGLNVTKPILAVLDGPKALRRAVLDVFDHPVLARGQRFPPSATHWPQGQVRPSRSCRTRERSTARAPPLPSTAHHGRPAARHTIASPFPAHSHSIGATKKSW